MVLDFVFPIKVFYFLLLFFIIVFHIIIVISSSYKVKVLVLS